MKSLLNALQEGRLIELPDEGKEKCLQYLAALLEAVPDFRPGFDFAGAVLSREKAANTAIGFGWACPHGRVAGEGELLSAVGWSPGGIDYGAPDGGRVRMVVMHCVPDSQRNAYLKEISTLAKVLSREGGMPELLAARDLGQIRHRMLDLLTTAMETILPDAKARMIQLEAKHAAALEQAVPADLLSTAQLIPLLVIVAPGLRPIVLSQDREIASLIETEADLTLVLAAQAPFERAGYRILVRSVTPYQQGRLVYDCLAVRLNRGAVTR